MRDYFILMHPATKELFWTSVSPSDLVSYRETYDVPGHVYKVKIDFERLTELWAVSKEKDPIVAWRRLCLVAHSIEDLDGSLY